MCINVWKKSEQKPDLELHASAAMHPSLLISVASTIYLVGHNIFIFFVDLHKNKTSKELAWRLSKSAGNSASS